MSAAITPETKIAALLEAHPQLEEELVACAPAFAKLRNPVLRRTVARVTSLRQAALVGGLDIGTLVNRLRRAAGQGDLTESVLDHSAPATIAPPGWHAAGTVTGRTDADALLEAGEHPVHSVLEALKALQAGEIHEVDAPFLPVPLIEKAQSLGYLYWSRPREAGAVTVAFAKPTPSA